MRCLDTTFLIDFLHGDATFATEPDEVSTSAINVFEVYLGTYALKNPTHRERELKQLDQLFSAMQILPLTHQSAQRAAGIAGALIREGKQIDGNDTMIAAIALAHGVSTICTRNAAHFNRIPGITVEGH